MAGRYTVIQDLLESIDAILDTIEENELMDEDFTVVLEVANNLREEIVALQE